MLTGKKTFIVAGLAAIATFLWIANIISGDMVLMIDAVLAPFGLAFLRDGIKSELERGR